MKTHSHLSYPFVLLLLLSISGCSSALSTQVSQQAQKLFPSIANVTPTPFQPVPPTPTATQLPTPTAMPTASLNLWLDPAMPDALSHQISLPGDIPTTEDPAAANVQIGALRGDPQDKATWVYALVAPFPTITDEVSLEEIQRAWRGEDGQTFAAPLLLSATTHAAFSARWGPSAGDRLQILPEADLLDAAWASQPAWAIIPFEDIAPRWKVLRVDGQSPMRNDFRVEDYPLTVWFGVTGQPEALRWFNEHMPGAPLLPATNRDPRKLTTLVMTGVTALTRATGYKMDTQGVNYPAQDIQDWLRNADLTHISNEVSFNPDCPKANFADTSTMFCSRPEYMGLLDFIGADIIELSGNHNNDWGRTADRYALDLYQQHGMQTFAGGANLEEARRPLKIDHHGNHLAFVGCNPAGPPNAWATADEPGAAPCGDYAWLHDTITQLRADGYLPIVTFQYFELYTPRPSEGQQRDFRAAAEAGAAIISGSQAHFPQMMEFYKDTFIHYGLGNLFFDQMDIPVVGTRREFIDQHTFYDGKYLGVELKTAMLEDYARPRPMNTEERQTFLADIFHAAGW